MDEKLQRLFKQFTKVMKVRLLKKEEAGWSGWDERSLMPLDELMDRIFDNLNKGDWIDVANLAMFAFYHYGGISDPERTSEVHVL